jgi:hypothetical protein
MKIGQALLKKLPTDLAQLDTLSALEPNLVLVFGSMTLLEDTQLGAALSASFPGACRIGCSTAGEIVGREVMEDTVVVTAMHFDNAHISSASTELVDMADSMAAGERLGAMLAAPGLKAVLVFGQGVGINGSALVAGLTSQLGPDVALSGGLAGDGGAFQRTLTVDDQGTSDRRIVAVGLAGDSIQVAHGCFGGWQAFGPTRRVTRSRHNVLFELDGEPALEVYKRYLGEYAKDLPASGLLFPFEMLQQEAQPTGLFRTILGIDEKDGSLTLAGDIDPQGYLRLMYASTNKLVDGAEHAASQVLAKLASAPDVSLSLLVSCVGRKLVMGGRVDEEVEAVADVVGNHSVLTGFYSYGEISFLLPGVGCALHNQTMTITHISEADHD